MRVSRALLSTSEVQRKTRHYIFGAALSLPAACLRSSSGPDQGCVLPGTCDVSDFMRTDQDEERSSWARDGDTNLLASLAEGHKPVSTVETLGENLNMAWSSDGKTIVIGNRNDKVVWVDVDEQKITRRIDMGKDVSVPSSRTPRRLRVSTSAQQTDPSIPVANERVPFRAQRRIPHHRRRGFGSNHLLPGERAHTHL